MDTKYTVERSGQLSVIVQETDGRYTSPLIEVSAYIDYTKDGAPRLERGYNSRAIRYTYRIIRYKGDALANWVGNPTAYISNSTILAAKYRISKLYKAQLRAIEEGKRDPRYNSMFAIVNQYVQNYKTDFTYHDTLALSDHPHAFIWIVRPSGTWFLTDYNNDFTRAILAECEKNSECRYYIANYAGIQLANYSAAIEHLQSIS